MLFVRRYRPHTDVNKSEVVPRSSTHHKYSKIHIGYAWTRNQTPRRLGSVENSADIPLLAPSRFGVFGLQTAAAADHNRANGFISTLLPALHQPSKYRRHLCPTTSRFSFTLARTRTLSLLLGADSGSPLACLRLRTSSVRPPGVSLMWLIRQIMKNMTVARSGSEHAHFIGPVGRLERLDGAAIAASLGPETRGAARGRYGAARDARPARYVHSRRARSGDGDGDKSPR